MLYKDDTGAKGCICVVLKDHVNVLTAITKFALQWHGPFNRESHHAFLNPLISCFPGMCQSYDGRTARQL